MLLAQHAVALGRPIHVIRALCAAAAALALAALLSAESAGAMYVRMSVTPISPSVGEAARLAVQTGFLTHGPCIGDAGASFTPMRSEDWYSNGKGLKAGSLAAAAEGPEGRRIEVALSPRSADTSFWDGELTFTAPGEWIVHMTRPEWGNEDCGGARLRVMVRGMNDEPDVLPLVVAGGVVLVALAAWRLRRFRA